MEKYTKLNDNTIQVEMTETHSFKYDYDYLISQRKILKEQKDKFIAEKETELKKLDGLIKECEKLGIKSIIKDRK